MDLLDEVRDAPEWPADPGLAAGVTAVLERLIGLFRSLSPSDGLSLTAAATLALPIVREAGTSGTGSTVIKACLMVSFAISGRPSAGASALARVVFPLAGGPDTTTYLRVGHRSVTPSLSRPGADPVSCGSGR